MCGGFAARVARGESCSHGARSLRRLDAELGASREDGEGRAGLERIEEVGVAIPCRVASYTRYTNGKPHVVMHIVSTDRQLRVRSECGSPTELELRPEGLRLAVRVKRLASDRRACTTDQ